MPVNKNDNFAVQECTASQTITIKIKGNNVMLQFAPKRNDDVCNQVKKILLASYLNKKA